MLVLETAGHDMLVPLLLEISRPDSLGALNATRRFAVPSGKRKESLSSMTKSMAIWTRPRRQLYLYVITRSG